MRFGKTLKNAIYTPWKDQYIDYQKLKKLLRESNSDHGSSAGGQDDDDAWTETDEGAFVEELVNVQLEKVHNFQASTLHRLREETQEVENALTPLGVKAQEDGDPKAASIPEGERTKILNQALARLDKITLEISELEKYSRINYTGFLKAAKKHDRKRGRSYRVSPLLRVRLSALPFNTEDYSPMLYRLSAMYSFVRQSLGQSHNLDLLFEDISSADKYTVYKCELLCVCGPSRPSST
jgi:SPX domain protein involved in polyphosphate accumulation